ncbi:Diacylglycerol kinase family enzyme [Desulfonatronum thiosulfatophilum]|uniref:Diacylglycerol kinase family enzyme n=2 Tax=Desulfonatronum thiosulfatophilum TaxID=617002 RepID=A0A1G6D5B1_9BACT|nr:Diacylglycerol kinase family enzyme [Desulfonatronum thiosulfatophilum]
MTKIGAVINKNTGTLPPQQKTDRIEEIKEHLLARISADHLAIVSGDQIRQEVERLQKRGIEMLVVGGGDGTVSTAANILSNTGILLVVLPLGTKNNFCRDLGIPLEPVEAIRLMDSMQMKEVDLGEVNGIKFINNVSLGVYPKMVAEREEITKKRGWRKWQAQIVAALIALRKMPKMKLVLEDEVYTAKRFTPLVFVGNNEYQGGFESDFHRPAINEGKLWLCMARSLGILTLLRMIYVLSVRGIQEMENLEMRSVTKLIVRSHHRKLKVAIDGEIHKLSMPLRFRSLEKALRVAVP